MPLLREFKWPVGPVNFALLLGAISVSVIGTAVIVSFLGHGYGEREASAEPRETPPLVVDDPQVRSQ